MFSCVVRGDLTVMATALDLERRLLSRIEIPPKKYDEIMNLREKVHNARGYQPKSDLEGLFKDSYYLENIDDKFRRSYGIKQ